MTAIQRILVIDDDSDVGELIFTTAQAMGLSCAITTDAESFLGMLTPETTLIMLDLVMPEMDGIELLRLLGHRQCKVGIVLMSGVGKRILETAEEMAQTLGLSIVGHLQKPFRITELEGVIGIQLESASAPVFKETHDVPIQDTELRNAIERDEFVLHYQPQIDLATCRVIGMEALVRWQHPERSLIYPDEFIARMEALGLIDRLGWIITNRGLADAKKFADEDGVIPILSLNVSIHSLQDLKFPDIFISLARKYEVPPENITVEITESGLIQELSSTLDVLTRLRMKQVHLSIDDFGTGYAMMQQLRHVPATELKIDKSFVQRVHVNHGDRVMVQKTIEIGHELGMKVVAEGVETPEQLEFLRESRCDAVQGYLFSRPLPVNELLGWLKKYRLRQDGIAGESWIEE